MDGLSRLSSATGCQRLPRTDSQCANMQHGASSPRMEFRTNRLPICLNDSSEVIYHISRISSR